MAFSVKTRKLLVIFLLFGWAVALAYPHLRSNYLQHRSQKTHLYRDNRLLMGTVWQVVSADPAAFEIVFSEAGRIDRMLSKYIPSSEVSELNRRGKLKVSPETFYVIKRSKELWEKTGGAFDITVAPLVSLWGFGSGEFRIPDQEQIRKAQKLIGSDKIILHEFESVVEFKIPGMQIDLGGIAKGYALDCAVKKLTDHQISDCLITAGGQVYALGDRSGQPWKIALRGVKKSEIAGTFELKNQSASTSADYEQFFLKDGKRYGHILDPRSGYPAEAGVNSVTVIADSGMEADALSTAIFVAGKDKAGRLAKDFPGALVKIY